MAHFFKKKVLKRLDANFHYTKDLHEEGFRIYQNYSVSTCR